MEIFFFYINVIKLLPYKQKKINLTDLITPHKKRNIFLCPFLYLTIISPKHPEFKMNSWSSLRKVSKDNYENPFLIKIIFSHLK